MVLGPIALLSIEVKEFLATGDELNKSLLGKISRRSRGRGDAATELTENELSFLPSRRGRPTWALAGQNGCPPGQGDQSYCKSKIQESVET